MVGWLEFPVATDIVKVFVVEQVYHASTSLDATAFYILPPVQQFHRKSTRKSLLSESNTINQSVSNPPLRPHRTMATINDLPPELLRLILSAYLAQLEPHSSQKTIRTQLDADTHPSPQKTIRTESSIKKHIFYAMRVSKPWATILLDLVMADATPQERDICKQPEAWTWLMNSSWIEGAFGRYAGRVQERWVRELVYLA